MRMSRVLKRCALRQSWSVLGSAWRTGGSGFRKTARWYSSSQLPTEATVARFERYGRPEDVLQLVQEPLPQVGDNDVMLEILMAPINPSDLNVVEGVYPVKPKKLPAVAGNEGVAQVIAVGSNVKNLTVDDWVIPAEPGFGTWRTHAVCNAEQVLKVPQDIKPEYAATIAVNPTTAVRLLEDFVELKEGDVIIQNGGSSAVGQAVMQLANLRGIKTISTIRARDVNKYDLLTERLKYYGSHLVVPEDDLGTPIFKQLTSDLPKPKLALNSSGGQSATDLARTLADDGVMVTYGGMSRKPVQVPTSLLIFKNIQLQGFWMTRWNAQHSVAERMKTIKHLWDLVREKKFRMWLERFIFEQDFFGAIKRNGEQRDRKVLLVMKPHKYVRRGV
eukprot:TRINITY_DN7257_c0_g1_i1.p1 TRINITY_DN7257_c0_g1~~TRINITY_DN7257_c0_g1_i1.p1  ORF type:complete len:389 (+),score=54.42 TRINITY_DN7257_c0_g1_i1:1033-2199(+)